MATPSPPVVACPTQTMSTSRSRAPTSSSANVSWSSTTSTLIGSGDVIMAMDGPPVVRGDRLPFPDVSPVFVLRHSGIRRTHSEVP